MSATLGLMLRELREAAGLSQRELARRLSVDSSYLSHLEANRREPSIELLRRVSRELGAPLGLFVAGVLAAELPKEEKAVYQPVIASLLEVAKARQLNLKFSD